MRRCLLACPILSLLLAIAPANAQVLNFGWVNVGTAAPAQILTYTFSGPATTLSAVDILTAGAPGRDYSEGGSSTCAVNATYSAGQSCTVTVAFTPSAPGLRSGGVVLFVQGSNLPLMTWYLNGVGQSGAITIDPGTESTIGPLSGGGQGYGMAMDGAGNLYVADHANNQVIELPFGSFTQRTVVSSGLASPTAVALDGAGNLYISDTGNGRVAVVPNEQTGLNGLDISTVDIAGLGAPIGIAVDGSGNLYVADGIANDVIEVPPGGGTPATIASALPSPWGVAVDSSGNVYVSANNAVTEYQPPFTGTPIPVGSGYSNPHGVAVDASGTVWVADTGNSRIVRVAPAGGSQATLAFPGTANPQSVAADAAGNLYVTSAGSVYVLNRTQSPALVFGNTFVGSTSGPQTLTVSDAGNQLLTISSLALSANFTQIPSGETDCTASTQLSSSAQCSIAVAFAPTLSGTLTGSFSVTDNALNNPASVQAVPLSGIALQVAQTITFPAIPPQTYGVGSIALNAIASSGLPVSYAVTSGPATVSNTGPYSNVLIVTGVGSVSVQATQVGNAQFAAAVPVSQTFTVSQAVPAVTFTQNAPATALYNSSFTVAATSNSGSPVSFSSSGVCTNTGATFTMTSGTGTCRVTATSAATTDYLAASSMQSTTAGKIPSIITFTGAPATASYQSTFAVATTSNSGVTAAIKAAGACSISGSTVTMTSGNGACTLGATWATNNNYLGASATQSTNAVRIAQVVAFTGAPATAPYQSTFTVIATTNSGIAPTITASGSCSIGGNTVTITSGSGTCAMGASWVQNSDYLSAAASQSTTVAKATPVVTFTGAPATAPYKSTFTVTATANSGVTPSLAGTVGVCSISAANVTMTGSSGTCITKATWPATAYYLGASATQTTTAQRQASIVTWPTPSPIVHPTALSTTQLNATANVAGTFVYSPPTGTVLTAGNQTLSLRFTPTNTNYAPYSGSVTLTVDQGLAITSPNSANFTVGVPGSFELTTVGFPTPTLSETGPLPTGLTFTDNGDGTGTLQGTLTPDANGVFNIAFTAQNGLSPNAVQSFTLTVNQVSAMAAARFLEQSSWGPTPATIAAVQQAGLPGFLQQQFSAPISTYPTPGPTANLDVAQNQFFVNAIQGQDQLRQRVSFALSEIIVVSSLRGPVVPSAFTLWMNMLQNDAFGNFYTLLNDVTLSPTMGDYLNTANNNGCNICRPNENYGREVLQLFTIGLNQLNLDGTLQLGSNGDPISTYTQNTIDGFAQVFTGWSYPPASGQSAAFGSQTNFTGPMLPFNSNHVQGSKLLLNGTTLPAGGGIQSDLSSGLQNIFNHPNVAPFICQQLIQKLVASNPSPDYVSRVAQVFNDDGTGVRGNLQAVVAAILLDPEARRGDDPAQVQPSDGHLREPLLYMLTAMRALSATTDGANLSVYAGDMLQAPFTSPDVFNFYPPNFQIPGTQLLGPEFGILDASGAMARANFVNSLIYGTVGPHTAINLSPYTGAAGDVGTLLALVNANLMHGQMPSDMYTALFTTLSSPAFAKPAARAQAALYLTLSSSQFQVEH